MTKLNTTRLSMEHMTNEGYTCEVVEHHMRHGGRTRDLFGVFDILALNPTTGGTVGVQTTDITHRADRIKKVESSDILAICRACGWGVVVHAWRHNGKLEEFWLLKPRIQFSPSD